MVVRDFLEAARAEVMRLQNKEVSDYPDLLKGFEKSRVQLDRDIAAALPDVITTLQVLQKQKGTLTQGDVHKVAASLIPSMTLSIHVARTLRNVSWYSGLTS